MWYNSRTIKGVFHDTNIELQIQQLTVGKTNEKTENTRHKWECSTQTRNAITKSISKNVIVMTRKKEENLYEQILNVGHRTFRPKVFSTNRGIEKVIRDSFREIRYQKYWKKVVGHILSFRWAFKEKWVFYLWICICLCRNRAWEDSCLLNPKTEDPEACKKSSTGNAGYWTNNK